LIVRTHVAWSCPHCPLRQPKDRIFLIFDNDGCKRTHIRNAKRAQAAQMENNGDQTNADPEQPERCSEQHEWKAKHAERIRHAVCGKYEAANRRRRHNDDHRSRDDTRIDRSLSNDERSHN